MDFTADLHPQQLIWVMPVLILVGMVEGFVYTRVRHRPFDWRSSFTSLGVAIGHRLTGLFLSGIVLTQFTWFSAHRLLDIPVNNWEGILALFVAVEFFYYWQHRLSHEIRWFWASHSVHHSPEQIALSSAYRLGWTSAISGMGLLFAPLVLIGFPSKAVLLMLLVNLLYQFWLHTELVPRLGWFDRVFNSPSNHRVHHASNAEYLDKNYGGVLILFDQIFGTYMPEKDNIEIRYGLVGRHATYNPFSLAFREWIFMMKDIMQAHSLHDRLLFVFGRPGWQPGYETISVSSPKGEKPMLRYKKTCLAIALCLVISGSALSLADTDQIDKTGQNGGTVTGTVDQHGNKIDGTATITGPQGHSATATGSATVGKDTASGDGTVTDGNGQTVTGSGSVSDNTGGGYTASGSETGPDGSHSGTVTTDGTGSATVTNGNGQTATFQRRR